MARPRTRKEIKVLQGNYGYGWDDLCYYEFIGDADHDELSRKELKQDLKDYRENEHALFRVITRYEKM